MIKNLQDEDIGIRHNRKTKRLVPYGMACVSMHAGDAISRDSNIFAAFRYHDPDVNVWICRHRCRGCGVQIGWVETCMLDGDDGLVPQSMLHVVVSWVMLRALDEEAGEKLMRSVWRQAE